MENGFSEPGVSGAKRKGQNEQNDIRQVKDLNKS